MIGDAEDAPTRARPCPLCGSPEKELLFAQRFTGIAGGSLLAGYDVVVCRRCGFGFADNLPRQTVFEAYYREMSKYENPERGGGLSDFDRRRLLGTADEIERLLPDREARILDIGCATGGLLDMLKGRGYRHLLGVDPSPSCVELGRRLHGIEIVPGSLADLPPGLGSFDCVVLGAVLEHLVDLSGALRDMRSLLTPGGLLYVDVPDVSGFGCAGHAPPYQEFSVEHINYFSTGSLASLMRFNGFREVFSRRAALEQAPGITVHEIKAAFRPDGASRGEPQRDDTTAAGLRAYIAASAAADRALAAVISRLVAARTPIVVWGVGTLTQRLLALGGLDRAVIRAFVDSNPRYQGRTVGGIPVISPEALRGRPEPILVSSLVHEAEIIRQIRADLGLGNEVVTFSAPEAGVGD